MKTKTLLFSAMVFLSSVMLGQNTIHVPGDYYKIQDAINAASDDDEVVVDTGTYYENIDFKGKAITVKSYFDPNNPDSSFIYNTVIDGSMPAYPDSASVVYFINGEDTTSVISGFTIRGGTGTKVYSDLCGGGILIYKSGAKIIHNRIVNNHISDTAGGVWDYISGGGIYGYDNLLQQYLVIKHNIIGSNSCSRYKDEMGWASGGGISLVYYKECFIEDNQITNNIAYNGVDDCSSMGGGIEFYRVKGFVRDNYISDNEIVSTSQQYIIWGAGMYCYYLKEGSIISNNTYKGNTADAPWSKAGGLGIGSCQDGVIIDGNLIVDNSARRGGGLALGSSTGVTIHITNNVIRGNYAQYRNGGLLIQGSFKGSSEFPVDMRDQLSDNAGNNAKSSGAIVLANNTFYENTEDQTTWSSAAEVEVVSDNAPLVAFNNIFYNTTESDYVIRLEDGSMAHFYYNILDEDRIHKDYNSEWKGDNNFYEDPLLMEDSIHILEESPCKEAGVENIEIAGELYYCPIVDFEYEERPLGVTDIGADEWYPDTRVPTITEINTEVFIYPNPVSSTANIRYPIFDIRYSNLSIYDAYGRLIETLVDGVQQPGEYTVSWNAENLPSGIYIYRLVAGDEVVSGKIIKR